MFAHILALTIFPLHIYAELCTPTDSSPDSSCSTPTNPLRVFATFSVLCILLLVPFLACAICRRRHPVPPDLIPLRLPAPHTPPFPSQPPEPPNEAECKTPRPPPPSYSPA
ncbi:hypothetical protein B0H13DRAFT_2314973 [Mycena leptocephala]|nr:hypothetical protein B0H13DRAFT_2314973 [Mycena leptocephala]